MPTGGGGLPSSPNAFQIRSPGVYSPERPRRLVVGVLRRQHQRRGDVVARASDVERAHAPRKLPDDVVGRCRRGLEQLERLALVVRGRVPAARGRRRHRSQRGDVVPVALVLAEIAEPLFPVEEQVFVPAIRLVVDDDVAVLVADDLVLVTVEGAARAQRNLRHVTFSRLRFLEDEHVRVVRILDRGAARAGDRLGERDGLQLDGRAAVAAVEARGLRPRPFLDRPQVLELELVERRERANEEQRRRFAVVDGREVAVGRPEVRELDLGLVPVLERQLPFDAAILRARDRGQLKREIPERVGLADLQFTRRRQRAGTRDPRDGILRLGVGQPSARVVAEDEMPLVPRAVFVLVDDAPGDREGVALKPPARADLDGRAGERQVRDDAHRLEVDVVAHDDGPAVPAHRLHRARPAELDGRRAVGARGDGAGHGCGGSIEEVPRAGCVVLRAVLRAGCCLRC